MSNSSPENSNSRKERQGDIISRRRFLIGLGATTFLGALNAHKVNAQEKKPPKTERENSKEIIQLKNIKITVDTGTNLVTLTDAFGGSDIQMLSSAALPGYKTPKGHYKIWWDLLDHSPYNQYFNIPMLYDDSKYAVDGFVPVVRINPDGSYDEKTIQSGNLEFGFHGVPKSRNDITDSKKFSDDPNHEFYPKDEPLGSSHGCRRLNQKDIRRLFLRMQFIKKMNDLISSDPNNPEPIEVLRNGKTIKLERKLIKVDINVI